jgi:hypothetical protein
MKFSGPVLLLTSNFWAGESNQPAQRLQPWAKNGLILENLSPPGFLSYRSVTYLFGNLRTTAKKSRERNFEFWGRARNIGP